MSDFSKARERILALLDENSFVEIGALVTARSSAFLPESETEPSDGVITGYGLIDGRLVYVYSQDSSVLGGTMGEMHVRKILDLYRLASHTGAPVAGLLDSAGIRLQEGSDAMNAFALWYDRMAKSSGIIPQITGVFGQCGGGLSLVPAISDFCFMADDARLFVNAPNALALNEEEKCDTACAKAKAEAGAVDYTGSEEEVLAAMRRLISILPSNNADEAVSECQDDLNRKSASVQAMLADPACVLADLADQGMFIELKKEFAPEMTAALMKIGGSTVGVIANRTALYNAEGGEDASFDALLTAGGCEKAASLVRFCDAFELPVISLTNVRGFASTVEEEGKVGTAAGKLVCALSDATVPKINVITGEACGTAYAVMNPKGCGADFTYALPDAKFGIMNAKTAAKILAAGKDTAEMEKAEAEFEKLQNGISHAAARGYIDRIVEADDLRRYLVEALEVLYSKRVVRADRKHTSNR